MRAPSSIDELEELLSRPDERALTALQRCPGDVLVLGAGGKMGPSLTRMLQRAVDELGDGRTVFAVSRFGNAAHPTLTHPAVPGSERIVCISADLSDPIQARALPSIPNVIFMAGQKFGTSGNPEGAWLLNAAVPALVATRTGAARTVCFSTGNVYPFVPVAADARGSTEFDEPAPVGEYAWSCLARERIFAGVARSRNSPLAIFRLNYAVDLRYGVLVDIARRVSKGEPIDLTVPLVNVIWQGDANNYAIAALALATAPPVIINATGARLLRVRSVAEQLGELLGVPPVFSGSEGAHALLSDASRLHALCGSPRVDEDVLTTWVASWIAADGELLNKPTHFEASDGRF